jgi:hypothetical protein
MRDSERLFRCTACGAEVQGWNAAHWYSEWHEDECPGGTIEEYTDEEYAEAYPWKVEVA